MLKSYLNKIKPYFQKGGRLHALKSTFEAFESFLYVPDHVTQKGAHIRDAIDCKRSMIMVVIALLPALFFGMWNVGYQHYLSFDTTVGFWDTFFYGFMQVSPILVVSYVVGLTIEFTVAQLRGHQVNEGFLVTGLLIPLICPPDIPLWMVACATAFAVVIGKEVFGGTGMNVWNPALLARAFLFFAYPSQMSGDKIWIAYKSDAFSGATPLSEIANDQVFDATMLNDMFYGYIPGCIGETSKLAIIIGAVILLWTGIASFRIMFSTIIGGLLMGFIFNIFGGSNAYMQISPYQHLLMGGFLFGAVFMATDPVTAAQTRNGKYIYGLLIGMIAVLIRVLNPAYLEGMMLAILLMNTFAPLIDYCFVEQNKKRRLKRASNSTPETI
ncbi:Na(+)-translocating NADH-quinone reductase subunit B [Bacteroidia bacterium]|nr:Na(+)-translocating NADH-quinone reductase subunit B [Bacteroidia bacterium]